MRHQGVPEWCMNWAFTASAGGPKALIFAETTSEVTILTHLSTLLTVVSVVARSQLLTACRNSKYYVAGPKICEFITRSVMLNLK